MDLTPPFIVSAPPECTFYRAGDSAAAACSGNQDVFDAHGLRLTAVPDGSNALRVSSVEPEELAHILRRWLGHVDALRESTASWPLWLLVHAAIEHAGYDD